MAGGIIWTKEELEYLKQNYKDKTNKELMYFLKRSFKAITYQASKYNLQKSYGILCKAKKRNEIEITKNLLKKLYLEEGKSIRIIAKELNLGKNTIHYYLSKYNIKTRSKTEANQNFYLNGGVAWRVGKTAKNNEIIRKSFVKLKGNWEEKKEHRIRKIEDKFKNNIDKIIRKFYWEDKLNQEDISKKLSISRLWVIELMKKYQISKRPNFEHISNLKGSQHHMYGKKWEEIYGIERAKIKKEETSIRSRKLIIKRLQNLEIPFRDTAIEKAIALELNNRKIKFNRQFAIGRFVCDFAIPEYKIAIECDGDYWHANPSIYSKENLNEIQKTKIRIDKAKNSLLRKEGWTLFRFFETDIKKSPRDCVNKIEMEIKNVQNPLDHLINSENNLN